MTLRLILQEVNSSPDLSAENVVEKIKDELQQKLPDIYSEWESNQFDINHTFEVLNCGLLLIAAKNGCGKVVKHLIKSGANVNVQDVWKKTSLHYSAQYGYMQVVEVLLEEGADVNAQDEDKEIPLHVAAGKRDIEIVQMLLEKVANVNLQDKSGGTALHYATCNANICTPMKDDSAAKIAGLLLQRGVDVNIKDEDGKTPLHYAIGYELIQTIEMLLKKGADANIKDKDGRAPLYYATLNYSYRNIRLGGKLLLDCDTTLLGNFYEPYKPSPRMAKLLLNYGANPSCIHRPKAITAGVAVGILAAIVTPLALVYATALPALAIIGITVASALIVGGISYGAAYKSSEHSLNSKLSEVRCSVSVQRSGRIR